jgi:hypothetical protein
MNLRTRISRADGYLYEIGRYKCLNGDFKGARTVTKRAFELNRGYGAKFVEDEDFDAVWESFGK